MQKAGIYFLHNRMIIHAMSKTKAGFWLADAPYLTLAIKAPSEEIVKAILNCLKGSKTGLANPTNWPAFHKALQAHMGLDSWGEVRDIRTKHCIIELEKKSLTFIPTNHDLTVKQAAFIPSDGDAVTIKIDAETSAIYDALRVAVNKCH